MNKEPNVVRFKTTRRKHVSGYRMFDVNGVVGSDVLHIVFNGVPVCKLDITDDGYINILRYLSSDTVKTDILGMSDCDINIERKGK